MEYDDGEWAGVPDKHDLAAEAMGKTMAKFRRLTGHGSGSASADPSEAPDDEVDEVDEIDQLRDELLDEVAGTAGNPIDGAWDALRGILKKAACYLGLTLAGCLHDVLERLVGISEETARATNECLRALDATETADSVKCWYVRHMRAEIETLLGSLGRIRDKRTNATLTWAAQVQDAILDLYETRLANLHPEAADSVIAAYELTRWGQRLESKSRERDFRDTVNGSSAGRDDRSLTHTRAEEWEYAKLVRKLSGAKPWLTGTFPMDQPMVRKFFKDTDKYTNTPKDVKRVLLGSRWAEGALPESTWFTNVENPRLVRVMYKDKDKKLVSKGWQIRGVIPHTAIIKGLKRAYGELSYMTEAVPTGTEKEWGKEMKTILVPGGLMKEMRSHRKQAMTLRSQKARVCLGWNTVDDVLRLREERQEDGGIIRYPATVPQVTASGSELAKRQWARFFSLKRTVEMMTQLDGEWQVAMEGELIDMVGEEVAGRLKGVDLAAKAAASDGDGFYDSFWAWIKAHALGEFGVEEILKVAEIARPWDYESYKDDDEDEIEAEAIVPERLLARQRTGLERKTPAMGTPEHDALVERLERLNQG